MEAKCFQINGKFGLQLNFPGFGKEKNDKHLLWDLPSEDPYHVFAKCQVS